MYAESLITRLHIKQVFVNFTMILVYGFRYNVPIKLVISRRGITIGRFRPMYSLEEINMAKTLLPRRLNYRLNTDRWLYE